jgi:uncharacterized protein YecE (DUF72 family)
MQLWVGTSGYSYPDWVGSFYPPGLRQGKLLTYYAQHFPLVELNFTFYRPPTATMLARLAEQTPEGFQFIVKMPRTLSHEKKPDDLPGFRLAVEELERRSRLLGVLCQLPQATHHLSRHRAWLERLAGELPRNRLAVEFRHHSWFHPEVNAWLGERGMHLVAVDVPDLPGLYPRGLVRSTPLLYVRFHSRHAGNWYQGDVNRYDYSFSDQELGEWIESIRQSMSERVFLLFNNCKRSQAAANAQRMRELLERMAPEMELVVPFASPRQEPRQQLLF